MNVSRADYVEKALKIDSAIEHLSAAKLVAENWMSKQADVPDWLRDYVHRTTMVQIPVLERERVRLDTVMEAINAGHNVGRNGRNAASGLSDSEINTMVKRADELNEDALTHIVNIEFTNEYFLKAAETGDALSVRLLLADDRVDPASKNNAAIWEASKNGHANVVRLLLEDGRADPASNRNNPIRIASLLGRAAVVKLLLADSRVDPPRIAFAQAIKYDYTALVKLFLEDKRIDPSYPGNDRLYTAAAEGHTEIVELLLGDPRVLAAGKLDFAFRDAKTTEIKEMISKAMHRGGRRHTRHTRNARTRHTRNARNRHTRQTRHRQHM